MTQHIKIGRARRRTRMHRKPYRQGDLDGLCGLYCLVNAVRALCPEMDREAAAALFEHLLQSLRRTGVKPIEAITCGVDVGPHSQLIKRAIQYVNDEFDIELTARRLPKPVRRSPQLSRLWRELAARLSPTCVAILGLGGRYEHWTVAVRASTRQIRLYDSSEMGVLRRGHCTVGAASTRTLIEPTCVVFIRRRN